ncbi:glycosyltransferase [Thauera sp. 28]|uniref:glycosyltransferase n=1 Tax=Thauera sp. 28 TaxID=303682 RepID=UPI0009FADEB4|nr:glycosyltransferase [Thauera sp. 28]
MSEYGVAFVLNRFASGGAETQVRRISSGLARRGWRVEVVSLMPDLIEPTELEAAGVRRINLQLGRGISAFRGVLPLARHLRAVRPDVVVSLMIPADPVARIAAAIAKVPLVSSLRNERVGGRAVTSYLRLTDGLAASLTANTDKIKSVLGPRVSARPERIEVVRNAIVTASFKAGPEARQSVRTALGLTDDAFVWVAVGAQRPQKNYLGLLRAFAALEGGRLLIVGEAYQGDELKDLAQELGIGDRVLQLGRRADIPEILAASDAFVMASHHEGLPNALMEAMAAGLPVVATDVGGIGDLLPAATHGLLVKAGDHDALVAGMRELGAMPDEARKAMGLCAQAHIRDNYELESVLNHWESLLKRVAGEHRSKRNKAA